MSTTLTSITTDIMKRVRLEVTGDVTGVGFRWFAYQQAAELGISGYAKNVAEGHVEIEAQGSEDVLDSFVEAIRRGPKQANVENVTVSDANVIGNEHGFQMH